MKKLDYPGLNYFLNKLKQIFLPRPATGNDGEFLIKVGNKTAWKALPNLLIFRGIVPTFNDLPSVATASIGDVWAVADQAGAEYYCSVDSQQLKFWDALGVHLGQYVEGDGIDIDIINHILSVKYQGALEVDVDGVLYVNPSKIVDAGQNISVTAGTGTIGSPSTITALGYKWDATLQSFAEGSFAANVSSPASGSNSHVEGKDNTAMNEAEHAEGKYNASHTGATNADKTIHSIGIGASSARANAVEVMANGDVYITGLGSYVGNNPLTATRLQDLVVKADWNASGTPAEILNKPTNLAVSYLSADITSGTTTTITAATHKCGTFPIVQVYHGLNVIYPNISVNVSGDVTVTWSGITVNAQTPIKIKIVG